MCRSISVYLHSCFPIFVWCTYYDIMMQRITESSGASFSYGQSRAKGWLLCCLYPSTGGGSAQWRASLLNNQSLRARANGRAALFTGPQQKGVSEPQSCRPNTITRLAEERVDLFCTLVVLVCFYQIAFHVLFVNPDPSPEEQQVPLTLFPGSQVRKTYNYLNCLIDNYYNCNIVTTSSRISPHVRFLNYKMLHLYLSGLQNE